MKKAVFAAAALMLGLVCALFLAELAVRWRAEGGLAGVWKSFFGGAVPHSEFSAGDTFAAHPDLGYTYNPELPEVNSLGIRGPEISSQKSEEKPRLVVIGDSVAAPRNGFVALLAGHLAGRAEVVNAAIPGYTVYQERLFLEENLPALKPDVVLLQYCLNDHHRILHQWDEGGRMLITEQARRALLPEKGGLLAWLQRRSYLALRLRLTALQLLGRRGRYVWEYAGDMAPAWKESGWRLYREEFAAIDRLLSDAGSRLAVAAFPIVAQFNQDAPEAQREKLLQPQERLEALAAEHGAPLLDLYGPLAAAGGPELFYDTLHLNDAGHRVAAREILEFLEREGLVEARSRPGG